MENKTNMSFVELPSEMVQYILSYVSFDEIAKLRSVSKSHDCIDSLGGVVKSVIIIIFRLKKVAGLSLLCSSFGTLLVQKTNMSRVKEGVDRPVSWSTC